MFKRRKKKIEDETAIESRSLAEALVVEVEQTTSPDGYTLMSAPVIAHREVSHSTIAACAEQIWHDEGCPEGRSLEHWMKAEHELGAKL